MRNIYSLAGGEATLNASPNRDPRLLEHLLAVARRGDGTLGETITRLATLAAAAHRAHAVRGTQ